MLRGYTAQRLVTLSDAWSHADNPLGAVTDGALVLDGTHIHYAGPRASAPSCDNWTDFGDRALTPGLVDAHTHACWAGSRHQEYAVRMAGGDYRAIAKQGGGILSTHRAIASATEEQLEAELVSRLKRMAALGVTCVEVKSGYGLEPDLELKQLRVMARVAQRTDLPAVVPTFLALHALPDSAKHSRESYVQHVAQELVPEVARQGLARYVDAYIDENAFTVQEGRLVAEAACRAGLNLRLHVGQFADVGGAALAAELGAHSVDHMEHAHEEAVAALARAGVTAVLLPIASFTLADKAPDVALFRKYGLPMAVASDANPGTAPTESLPLALAFAVRNYGLTPDEVWQGVTRRSAHCLGESLRGSLQAGSLADFVVWDLPHELALLQPWGTAKAHRVVREGRFLLP